MLEASGHKIDLLPISELTLFFDLVYVDSVVLSHYIDVDGKNYLQYWVDFNEQKSRWLLWRVSDDLLYKYINSRISLLDVIKDPSKDYIFSFDIGEDESKSNIQAIEVEKLPEEYLPDNNSRLQFIQIPSEYVSLFDSQSEGFYIEKLRETAINFKVSAEDPKYASTIGVSSVKDFLNKFETSYMSFAKVDFFKSFQQNTSDVKRLNTAYSALKPNLDLRIIGLQYGSFEISLSSDKVLAKGNQQYKEWQYQLLDKFKDDVVELDYESEESIDVVLKKYSEDERRRIYSPFIQIISNKDYRVNVSDNAKDFRKVYKEVKKGIKDKLVPKPKLVPPDEKDKILRIAVYEAEEDKELTDIPKAELKSNLFFTEPALEDVPWHVSKIEADKGTIFLKKSLVCQLSKTEKIYRLYNKEFNISVEVPEKEKLYSEFCNRFYEFYMNLLRSSAESDISLRSRLKEYISSIEEKQK